MAKVIFLHLFVILFTGGVLSQHALQVVSQYALQQVSRGVGIPACLAGFQAHTQGGSLGGSVQGACPGPHPRGKFRGICLGGVQAHTQGGSLGGSAGGCLLWGEGLPTPRGWPVVVFCYALLVWSSGLVAF